MSKVETKEIGHVWVDEGCVWLGDPCYIIGTDKPELETWDSFMDKMDFSKSYNQPIGTGVGFLVYSGYGNGSYPVSVEIEDGRVKSLTVTFIGDEEDDSDWESEEDEEI